MLQAIPLTLGVVNDVENDNNNNINNNNNVIQPQDEVSQTIYADAGRKFHSLHTHVIIELPEMENDENNNNMTTQQQENEEVVGDIMTIIDSSQWENSPPQSVRDVATISAMSKEIEDLRSRLFQVSSQSQVFCEASVSDTEPLQELECSTPVSSCLHDDPAEDRSRHSLPRPC
ncbi:hypothetical protein P9112_010170 [Eukaryota sp. TZLM1-RC]